MNLFCSIWCQLEQLVLIWRVQEWLHLHTWHLGEIAQWSEPSLCSLMISQCVLSRKVAGLGAGSGLQETKVKTANFLQGWPGILHSIFFVDRHLSNLSEISPHSSGGEFLACQTQVQFLALNKILKYFYFKFTVKYTSHKIYQLYN